MANEIQILNYNDRSIRQTVSEDGEILFCAYDVAQALGYRDSDRITRLLDEDERPRIVGALDAKGEHRNTPFITEYQLYDVLMALRTERTKPFRRWVTHEVVPSIRKHGFYSVSPTIAKSANPALIQMNTVAQTEIARLDAENKILKEKTAKFDHKEEVRKAHDEAKKATTLYFIDPRTGKSNSRAVGTEVKDLIDSVIPVFRGRGKFIGRLIAKYESMPKGLVAFLRDYAKKRLQTKGEHDVQST